MTTAGRLGGLPFFVIVSIPRTLSEAKDTARDDPIRRPRRPSPPSPDRQETSVAGRKFLPVPQVEDDSSALFHQEMVPRKTFNNSELCQTHRLVH